MTTHTRLLMLALTSTLATLSGCVTSTVDEMVFNEPTQGIGDGSVVILGRRHASDYETEPDFIRCVGRYITSHDKSIHITDEQEFVDAFYPWFEPRTAPLHPGDIQRLLQQSAVAKKVKKMKTKYMIWIDGSTVRGDSAGSMTCAVGPGGGGCFGFGTWSDSSDYEATIWDFTNRAEVGRVNATASGQSYMPAVIIPLPIIAPVEGTACDSVGAQLLKFLSNDY